MCVWAESSRRTKTAGGVNGESLEQYKTDNQTLLLQVGLSVHFLNAGDGIYVLYHSTLNIHF